MHKTWPTVTKTCLKRSRALDIARLAPKNSPSNFSSLMVKKRKYWVVLLGGPTLDYLKDREKIANIFRRVIGKEFGITN